MPDLRCTVQTCTHNQNYYCNLDSIVVGGNSAKKAAIITKRENAEKECLVYFYHRIQYYICQGAKMKKLDLTLTNVMMMK